MHDHPRDPREKALHLHIVHRDDGVAAANRRHSAHVLVRKLGELRGRVFDQALEILHAGLRLLCRHRRHRRQRAAVLHKIRAVADSENLGEAFDLKRFLHHDAPRTVGLRAEILDEGNGLDARRPNDGFRRDDAAVFQLQFLAVIIHDLRGNSDVNFPNIPQHAHRLLLQLVGHHRQHMVHRFHQNDLRFGEIKVVVLVSHDAVNQLGQRARTLHARRAAADAYEGQHAAALRFVFALRGPLEHPQDVIADRHGLLQRLHAEGMFRDVLHAEEIRHRARRQHQIIVRHFSLIGNQHPVLGVEILRVRHEETDVLRVAEKRANRICDLVLVQFRRGKLVQQRLKHMEIVPVDNRDVHRQLRQLLRHLDAAEAGAHDDDMRSLVVCHKNQSPTCPKSNVITLAAKAAKTVAKYIIFIRKSKQRFGKRFAAILPPAARSSVPTRRNAKSPARNRSRAGPSNRKDISFNESIFIFQSSRPPAPRREKRRP